MKLRGKERKGRRQIGRESLREMKKEREKGMESLI
jgi:hypothetical protein